MQQAREWIAAAKSVAVLTGAGISAESGVPTFRGGDGLWRKYRAEELATPQAFGRDPKLVWEWYNWRREVIAAAQPNAGHRAVVELEHRKAVFTLITQNVDGLHDRAGNLRILKLHGDIWDLQCTACSRIWQDRRTPLPDLPRCACGEMARPDVVWFGEPLPAGIIEDAAMAVESADVLLVVGTSAVVYPAAGLIPLAKSRGCSVIEVNPETTPFSELVDQSLRGSAGTILPRLLE